MEAYDSSDLSFEADRKRVSPDRKTREIQSLHPALQREEYKKWETQTFLKEVHGGSLQSFFAALSGGEKLSGSDIEELKQWLLKQ